ncbi:DDE-type integrase/transposase/recombinase [Ahrensia kielensis]|uniref:DDE-type integrase/transposase/recombinase n=1 Tax=Ahrensia kielensis TaxID=76980 RepID=UPI003CCC46C5
MRKNNLNSLALKLGCYGAVFRELGINNRHEIGLYKDNQVENSHSHFRRRERVMGRFRSMASLQKFSSIHAAVFNQFSLQRHFLSRPNFKHLSDLPLNDWRILCVA